jgi:hypothetical protein
VPQYINQDWHTQSVRPRRICFPSGLMGGRGGAAASAPRKPGASSQTYAGVTACVVSVPPFLIWPCRCPLAYRRTQVLHDFDSTAFFCPTQGRQTLVQQPPQHGIAASVRLCAAVVSNNVPRCASTVLDLLPCYRIHCVVGSSRLFLAQGCTVATHHSAEDPANGAAASDEAAVGRLWEAAASPLRMTDCWVAHCDSCSLKAVEQESACAHRYAAVPSCAHGNTI